MFGIGGSEFIIIAIIALIFLGPDKLPEATKKISRGIRELKKGSRTLQATIENDEHIGGAIRDLKSALRGEDPAPRPPRRKKVKKKKIAELPEMQPGDEVVEASAKTQVGGVDAQAPDAAVTEPRPLEDKKPAVKLPLTAGEVDPDGRPHSPADDDKDAEELAALIKPAANTIGRS